MIGGKWNKGIRNLEMYGLYCSVPDALSYGLYLWVVLAHYIKCGKREQGIRNYRYQNDTLYLLFLLPVSYSFYCFKTCLGLDVYQY